MNNGLKKLEEKYKAIASDSMKIEEDLYHSVMSKFAYKKISKGKLYNIRPFEIQRSGFKIGRELKSLPKAIKNTHIYYFDIEDKVFLIEIYGKTENILNRNYYFYEDHGIESIYFNSGTKSVRNIDFSISKNGRIMESLNYGEFGCSISNYIYQENVLMEIDVQQKERSQTEFSSYKVLFEYKDNDLEKIYYKHPNGYEEQRYP